MKQQTLNNLIKIAAVISIAILTSCGTSKSNVGTADQASVVQVDSSKPLASCNKLNNSNFSMNIANAMDSSNQVDPQFVKIKFTYLSSDITQTGYSIRFYKWRVINNATQMDSNPLQFYSYNLSSGQTTSAQMSAEFATNVTTATAYYVNLNDDTTNPYQVLKVVAYKTDGTVAASADVLIPQFLANPNDYKLNPDGSNRASLLQGLHPLHNTDVSSWSSSQIQANFDQYCF
ncbi:MAG: hypothetical protein ACXVAX_06670 [Pseudobdellovibrio sp.]